MRFAAIVLILLLSLQHSLAEDDAQQLDRETGFIIGENWELVKANCTNCHSSKLVIQNRMNRQGWQDTIRWMQKKHSLWSLGEFETPILDYLENHYNIPAKVTFRRKNLQINN
jgi:hypothetical protein